MWGFELVPRKDKEISMRNTCKKQNHVHGHICTHPDLQRNMHVYMYAYMNVSVHMHT